MVVKRLDLESASIVTTLKTTILLIDVCVYKRAIKAQADEKDKRNFSFYLPVSFLSEALTHISD